MHKKVKGYIVFAEFGKKVNTNCFKKCLHNPCGYGIFFLNKWLHMIYGARRYFVIKCKDFYLGQSSFSLYRSEKLFVWTK